MKKLLLIVLVFLLIGTVSAHDDFNGTTDPVLKDTEYTSSIDDEDGMLVVGEDEYIPVEVEVDEAYSLKVYIDKSDCSINDDMDNVSYDQINIPTSVIVGDDEVPVGVGKHNIVYEFKFTNTTSLYRPEAFVSGSAVYFDFHFIRNFKNPQNTIYRFTSQFNITNETGYISQSFDIGEINITYSDSLYFALKGLKASNVNIYLDGVFFNSFETDESLFEEEIDTTKLEVGSYNLLCIVESDKVSGEYSIEADASNSMINVKFTKSKITTAQNRFTAIINATLNIVKIPEINPIYIDASSVEINYTRSIPIRLQGDNVGNLTVYIDGEKAYDSPILLSWENIIYIPTKDAGGNYFDVGVHDLVFEFTFQDKYARFNPVVYKQDNTFIFNFLELHDSTVFLNDKYVIKSNLTITDKTTQFIPIESDVTANIVHTDDLKIKINNLNDNYNLTVFVDDVEIYESNNTNDTLAIKTFFARSSIEEVNERDIQVGTHTLRFEFEAFREYSVGVDFKNSVLNFNFTPINQGLDTNTFYYQFNTTLEVTQKPKTVHILNVQNNTYFEDSDFIVKMDLYKIENDDWDDNSGEEPAIGTRDVGIIVSDEKGIVYSGDYLMNLYENMTWNYDFENELLPTTGTYTMKIINLADNTYDTASFNVKKADRTFTRKYSSDDFNVFFTLDFSSFKGDLKGLCTITLDNQEKTINVKSLSKSKREVQFSDINPGTYTATFTLKGDDIYNDVTLKSKVTVKKENPTIKYQTGSNSIVIKIDIEKSKTNANLIVNDGFKNQKFTINKNTGSITVDFDDLNSGSYNLLIDFMGNERYNSKTITVPIEITHHSNTYAPKPVENTTPIDNGLNDDGGIGIGVGDSNATGNGNGTYNGKITFNGKGFNGNLGSSGSGGVKGYEITKKAIKKIDESSNEFLILLIIISALLILSFIYERRDNEEDEY